MNDVITRLIRVIHREGAAVSMVDVKSSLIMLRQRFSAGGIDTPDLDARLLVQAAAGLSREGLAAAPESGLTQAQAQALEAMAERRLSGEPIAHILGTKAFWSLELRSDSRALTPRPETELIVEASLACLPEGAPARILDMGVGTGAILLAILSERAEARGVGADLSADALALARENAERLGLERRAAFIQSDWFASITGAFELIVSNPPYIPSAELAGLAPETRADPALALDGGPDGLTAYRRLAAGAPDRLAPGGVLILELGAGQADAVAALMQAGGRLRLERTLSDLAGHARTQVYRLVDSR